jgi:Na+-driven multidrug efflux pump
MVFCCFNQVLAGALRGTGDAKTPMYYLLFSQVVVRQIYLFIIARILPGNFRAIAIAFPVGWMLCSILMSTHFFRMDWEKATKIHKK